MKKLFSIVALATLVLFILPSCSQDEGFDDLVVNSDLDQQASTDQEEDMKEKPGSN